MKLLLSMLLLSVFTSCSCKSGSERDNIGKYLYLSENGVLHCQRTCRGLIPRKKGFDYKPYGITFIDTSKIIDDNNNSYCPQCFNDEKYAHVKCIIARNRKEKENRDMNKVYEVIVDGQTHKVKNRDIKKYGWDGYAESYPNATVRMQDDNGRDYDVPLNRIEAMINAGLHLYEVNANMKLVK